MGEKACRYVRRDRRFIESRYPGATFPDGTPVSFPTPHLTTERYDLDETYPNLVSEITTRISALKMARYRPSRYHRETAEESREAALSALLQSGILKRFESCWYACLLTVNRDTRSPSRFPGSLGRRICPGTRDSARSRKGGAGRDGDGAVAGREARRGARRRVGGRLRASFPRGC